MITLEQRLARLEAAQAEAQAVRCPACNTVYINQYSDAEDLAGLVTCWGEESPVRVECRKCKHDFKIRELVERTWEVVEQEAAARTPGAGTERTEPA